jgi:isochorismate hydrolase
MRTASSGIPVIEPYPLPTSAELPDNVARWAFEPNRALLLIHDMQRYFLKPLPASTRSALVDNVVALRAFCVAAGVPVGYTAQPGGMTERERGLLVDFWGPGMRVDPADRAVVDELAPAAADSVFTKWRYSAFHRSDLLSVMREHGRDQLLLCGVYAHVGLLATAVDAFTNDIQPFLVADAVADFSLERHQQALTYVAQRCGVVCTAKEVIG